jgi:mannose-6-phosphate isomerase
MEVNYSDINNNKFINNQKIIQKPWGKEVWLELNDKYCYKRIYINAGFKTSYQKHNFKLETNFIIKGQAEVWLENDDGVVQKFIMNEGDHFTVLPPRKHRVIAITDIILQEVSTPEVDDVIRINDEFNRVDGKIQEEHFKPVVCILAAGLGLRLGVLSENTHKALLPVKSKSIISNLIDKFDNEHEIIIAVGHLKEQVIEYIKLVHPDRNINFVDVNPYKGIDSGTAFSTKCCKSQLQRPFYWMVCDQYVDDNIQNLHLSNTNWISVKDTNLPELYSTIDIKNGKIINFQNKNISGFTKAFTGIFYMYDYKLFWNQFDKYVDNKQEIVDVFKNIEVFNFEPREIKLDDIGTYDFYFKLINKYEEKDLHKTKYEHKYKINNLFIKGGTKDKIDKLFARSEYLNKYIPKLSYKGNYFFAYEYFEGKTLYQFNSKEIYIRFFQWFENEFCTNLCKNTYLDLKKSAHVFYKKKTISRLELIKSKSYFNDLDNIKKINEKNVCSIDEYLNKIDWEKLYDIIPTTKFHGDLQFDNILYNGNTFKIIDWREDFGENTKYGDLYYDLSKLYGGMILNYLKMKNIDNYSYDIFENNVILKNYEDEILKNVMNNEFMIFLQKNNFNFEKVRLLTALIFLNMSPLHINNFDKFLFLKAKYVLSQIF